MAGCLQALCIIAGILSLPTIAGPALFWTLAYFIGKSANTDDLQAQQARTQHLQLLQATNPAAYAELLKQEEAERVARKKASAHKPRLL